MLTLARWPGAHAGDHLHMPAAARSHGSIYGGATPLFFLPEPVLSNKRIRSRLRAIYPYSFDLSLLVRNNTTTLHNLERAEKRCRWAGVMRVCDQIGLHSGVWANASAARATKHLIKKRIQATLPSSGSPVGNAGLGHCGLNRCVKGTV